MECRILRGQEFTGQSSREVRAQKAQRSLVTPERTLWSGSWSQLWALVVGASFRIVILDFKRPISYTTGPLNPNPLLLLVHNVRTTVNSAMLDSTEDVLVSSMVPFWETFRGCVDHLLLSPKVGFISVQKYKSKEMARVLRLVSGSLLWVLVCHLTSLALFPPLYKEIALLHGL